MEVLVIAVGINESLPTLPTNSKRESTIKKSTTHVVSGAFDVVKVTTKSLYIVQYQAKSVLCLVLDDYISIKTKH